MASWHGRPGHDSKLDSFVKFVSTKRTWSLTRPGCQSTVAQPLFSKPRVADERAVRRRAAGGDWIRSLEAQGSNRIDAAGAVRRDQAGGGRDHRQQHDRRARDPGITTLDAVKLTGYKGPRPKADGTPMASPITKSSRTSLITSQITE